jgi:hypothetical protein
MVVGFGLIKYYFGWLIGWNEWWGNLINQAWKNARIVGWGKAAECRGQICCNNFE